MKILCKLFGYTLGFFTVILLIAAFVEAMTPGRSSQAMVFLTMMLVSGFVSAFFLGFAE